MQFNLVSNITKPLYFDMEREYKDVDITFSARTTHFLNNFH